MFVSKAFIDHLEDEIKCLKKEKDKLLDMIIVLNNKTVDYNILDYNKTASNPVSILKEKTESIPVLNEKEKKQKEDALSELMELNLI